MSHRSHKHPAPLQGSSSPQCAIDATELLSCGLLIWIVVHVLPALGVRAKEALVQCVERGPYSGLFSLLIVAAFVCIVYEWRSARR